MTQKFMADENEFQVDTPEIYEREAALNDGLGELPETTPDVTAPVADDIDDEPAADAPQPLPVAPVAPVATVAPAPVAAAPATFDRHTVIPGLREDPGNSVEDVALQTKEILARQPKVRMMIPLDPGEKAGAYRTVVINGFRFDVRKNTMVDLPEAVAALLADAYQITTDVLENNPLNLNNADSRKRDALGM